MLFAFSPPRDGRYEYQCRWFSILAWYECINMHFQSSFCMMLGCSSQSTLRANNYYPILRLAFPADNNKPLQHRSRLHWETHRLAYFEPSKTRLSYHTLININLSWTIPHIRCIRGARGVMVIAVGNGHGDTSSNPGRDWLHFTQH